VADAVREVVSLSEASIDKIIFSGRSTAFPRIKDTVESHFKKEEEVKTIHLGFEELKTAVVEGACWYGVNKNAIRLSQAKANASFGFRKTLTADKTDVQFYELVEIGSSFTSRENGIGSYTGRRKISDDFAFDNAKVNFLQVMGKDAEKILSENQRHKYSRIASISLPQITAEVAIKVNGNDEVECVVKLETDQVIRERGLVSDQEIDDANEEHYTWVVK